MKKQKVALKKLTLAKDKIVNLNDKGYKLKGGASTQDFCATGIIQQTGICICGSVNCTVVDC